MIVGRDISERRRLESQLQQSQKMETVGQLAGEVGHDFNNLLTVIGGYVALAHDLLPPDNPVQSDLEEVQKAVERPAASPANCWHSHGGRSSSQNIEFERPDWRCEQAPAPPDWRAYRAAHTYRTQFGIYYSDPHQIEQLLINLAVNARDAMPDGGTLTIETANSTRHAGVPISWPDYPSVLLVVTDTAGHERRR